MERLALVTATPDAAEEEPSSSLSDTISLLPSDSKESPEDREPPDDRDRLLDDRRDEMRRMAFEFLTASLALARLSAAFDLAFSLSFFSSASRVATWASRPSRMARFSASAGLASPISRSGYGSSQRRPVRGLTQRRAIFSSDWTISSGG